MASEQAVSQLQESKTSTVERLLEGFVSLDGEWILYLPGGDEVKLKKADTPTHREIQQGLQKVLADMQEELKRGVILKEIQSIYPDFTESMFPKDPVVLSSAFILNRLAIEPTIPFPQAVLLCLNPTFYSALNKGIDSDSGLPTSLFLSQSEVEAVKKKLAEMGVSTGDSGQDLNSGEDTPTNSEECDSPTE